MPTSEPSTAQSSAPEIVASAIEADKSTEALAELEAELAAERDGRNEDRFFGSIVAIIVFDAYIFVNVHGWVAHAIIGALELVLVLGLAKRLGVQHAQILLDLLDSWIKRRFTD